MVYEFKECRKLNTEQIQSLPIKPTDLTKVIKQGDIVQVNWSSSGVHLGSESYVRRLDKDHYEIKATGEVKEYNHNTAEVEGIQRIIKMQKSLQRTFTNLRALINTNFTMSDIEDKRVLFLTLTYSDEVKGDEGNKRLYDNFKYFVKKLNRKYKDYGKVEYINVIEPQGSGRWHCHCLLKWSCSAPFIPFDVLNDLWPHGFVKVNLVGGHQTHGQGSNSIDNLGAYLTAYLTDLPLEDVDPSKQFIVEQECKDSIVEKNGKKYIKGGRLCMYPEGMKIYRASQGIKQPTQEVMTMQKVIETYGDCKTYETCKEVVFEYIAEDTEIIVDPLSPFAPYTEIPKKEEALPKSQPSEEPIHSVYHYKQYYNLNRKKSQQTDL